MKSFSRIIVFVFVWLFSAGVVFAGNAKNLIWVIGDGMGLDAMGFFMQGARYADLEGYVSKTSTLEQLMNTGTWGLYFNNTYDTLVTDSAAAATQMATGQFSRPGMIGLNYQGQPAETLMEMARKQGKAVGVISDTYVTDATPASFVSHTQSRKDRLQIAKQMVDFAPEVILGGGLTYFNTKENKNLLKTAKKKGYRIAKTKKELAQVKKGKVLGLFSEQAMPMTVEMYRHPQIPSLTEQAQKALEVLSQNKDGFVLMVEAGKIDWAAHSNDAGAWLSEMKLMDELLKLVKNFADENGDTLVYLSADHDTGLGAFTYRHVGKQKAMEKSAQGEVLYEGDVDYSSFKTLKQLELQKRSLYYVEEELKKIPDEERTPEVVAKALSDALGYEVDLTQFENISDVPGLFKQLNEMRGLVWATPSHSSLPILSVAYGKEAALFMGVYHNTDILPRLQQALGFEGN